MKKNRVKKIINSSLIFCVLISLFLGVFVVTTPYTKAMAVTASVTDPYFYDFCSYYNLAPDSYSAMIINQDSNLNQTYANYIASQNKQIYNNQVYQGSQNAQGLLGDKANNDSIYSGGIPLLDLPTTGKVKGVEKLLCQLLVALSNGLTFILEKGGLTIDNAIFGRVNGHGVIPYKAGGNVVSLLTFEMVDGNIYGGIAARVYQLIRGFSYAFMIAVAITRLLKVSLATTQMSIKEQLANIFKDLFLCTLFVMIMPYFLEVLCYIRDIMISAVLGTVIKDVGGDGSSIMGVYRDLCTDATKGYEWRNTAGIIDCMLYLGAAVISLVFAGMYVALALEALVLFVLFPFVCVKGTIRGTNVLNEWVGDMIGVLLTPLFDGILFCIPIYFMVTARDSSLTTGGSAAMRLIALMASGMLLTLRGKVRQALGLHASVAEGAGAGMIRGALSATAGAVGGAAMHAIGNKSKELNAEARDMNDIATDSATADLHEAMANSPMSTAAAAGGNPNTISGSTGTDFEPGDATGIGGVSPIGPDLSGGGGMPTMDDGTEVFAAGGTTYDGSSVVGTNGREIDNQTNFNTFEATKMQNLDAAARTGNLTHQQLADLYRARAKERANVSHQKQSLGNNWGNAAYAAASLAGGAVALGATAFMGPEATGKAVGISQAAAGALGNNFRDMGYSRADIDAQSTAALDKTLVPNAQSEPSEAPSMPYNSLQIDTSVGEQLNIEQQDVLGISDQNTNINATYQDIEKELNASTKCHEQWFARTTGRRDEYGNRMTPIEHVHTNFDPYMERAKQEHPDLSPAEQGARAFKSFNRDEKEGHVQTYIAEGLSEPMARHMVDNDADLAKLTYSLDDLRNVYGNKYFPKFSNPPKRPSNN